MDVAKAVQDIKGGKIEFRVDKHGNLHLIIGKASLLRPAADRELRRGARRGAALKPAVAKGRYLKKVTFATTMGPGIPVDPNRTRNLMEDDSRRPRVEAGLRVTCEQTGTFRRPLVLPAGGRRPLRRRPRRDVSRPTAAVACATARTPRAPCVRGAFRCGAPAVCG